MSATKQPIWPAATDNASQQMHAEAEAEAKAEAEARKQDPGWKHVERLVSVLSLMGFQRSFQFSEVSSQSTAVIIHGIALISLYILLVWQALLWTVATFNADVQLETAGPVGGSAVLWLLGGFTSFVSLPLVACDLIVFNPPA